MKCGDVATAALSRHCMVNASSPQQLLRAYVGGYLFWDSIEAT